MKVQGGLEWAAMMKTGPNNKTEIRHLGLWYVSYFFHVLLILKHSFFFF